MSSKAQLTKRQQEVLDFLKETHHKEGFMPSTRDIQRHFDFASQTAAMSHLRALERKGVIIRKAREPRKGDVVAALIDGETTLKRYVIEDGKPFLRAENEDYPDLIPARELIIQGVLVALLRSAA